MTRGISDDATKEDEKEEERKKEGRNVRMPATAKPQ